MKSTNGVSRGLTIALAAFALVGQWPGAMARQAKADGDERGVLRPRGGERLLYCHDSGIVPYNTWDPFTPDQLRQVANDLADVGVDTYVQLLFSAGTTRPPGIWKPRHKGIEFSGHSRFQPLHDEGTQPLDILIDQAHRRGMKFIGKLRMSDRHSRTGSGFVAQHPEWYIKEYPGAPDYSHEPVRQYMLAVMEEIVRRFDVDGLELNFIRACHCFRPALARESQPIMTEFVGRVRALLDQQGNIKKRKLILGVRVPQTLDECHNLGYDIPTWIRSELIDYVAPCDFHCSDFNAPYEEFAALTRGSQCRLYPTVHPPMLARIDKLMRPENYRALAHTMYAAGADGISVFNYMYHWARRGGIPRYAGPETGYPLALSYLRDLGDPRKLAERSRHYAFYPLWSASPYDGTSRTGATKNDRLVLRRDEIGQRGEYQFRLYEDGRNVRATLFFRAIGLTEKDEVEVDLNGHKMPADRIVRAWNPYGRWDEGKEWEDPRGFSKRRWRFERPLPAFSSFWFDLKDLPLVMGINKLGLRLIRADSGTTDDIIVDEVEVTVIPQYQTGRQEE